MIMHRKSCMIPIMVNVNAPEVLIGNGKNAMPAVIIILSDLFVCVEVLQPCQ